MSSKYELNVDSLNEFGTVKAKKHFATIIGEGKRKAILSKVRKQIQLQDYKKEYGEGDHVVVFTDAEAKKAHLGKTRCSIDYTDENHMKEILKKYFGK